MQTINNALQNDWQSLYSRLSLNLAGSTAQSHTNGFTRSQLQAQAAPEANHQYVAISKEESRLTAQTLASKISQDLKLLIAEDLLRSEEIVLESLLEISQLQKQRDVRSYGRLLKRIRRIVGDEPNLETEDNNPYLNAAGIMKNNPIWPEIAELIEKQNK